MLELEANKQISKRVDDILAGEDELDYRSMDEVQMMVVRKQHSKKKINAGALAFWLMMTLFNPGNLGRSLRPAFAPS